MNHENGVFYMDREHKERAYFGRNSTVYFWCVRKGKSIILGEENEEGRQGTPL